MEIYAISKYYNGISNTIITDGIKVTNPYTGNTEETAGIWDTGAMSSSISKYLAQKLGLPSLGKTTVIGVHGPKMVDIYMITLCLNNENMRFNIPVTECDQLTEDESACILIGMDIITKGDFCITHLNGRTVMSFRTPSVETIDWVAKINERNKYYKMHLAWSAHGNHKCPCGSGKLYKNCHGKDLE